MDTLSAIIISGLCSCMLAVAGWLVTSTTHQIERLAVAVQELTTAIASLDGRYVANHEWMTRLQGQVDRIQNRPNRDN